MTKVTFFQQLGGLVRRNFLIKKRRKFFTAMEIILPIYFVIILMIIRSSSPSVNYPAVTVPRKPFDPMNLYFLKSLADPIAIVSNLNSSELKKFEDQLKQISHQQLNFTTVNSTDDEFIKNNSFPIIIDLTSDFSGNVSYMLRFLSDELPKTTELFSSQSNCRNELSTFSKSCPADLYLTSGFVTLQYIIDQAISKMKIINEGRTLNVSFQLFPKGEYMEQANYLRSVLPLYMVLAFSPFVTYVVILIVSEKETKIRETMKIMGLKDFAYWTSWLIVYGLFVFIISLLVSLLLIECKILPKANMFLLFINIFLYGISILTLSFMVTPFFNKAKMAGSFSSLASTFISCLYYIKVYVGGGNSSVYWIMSLASPTAFALNIDTALTEDLYKSGIGFDSLWEGSFPFASGLIMLLVDIILYAALAYYLDSVLPGEFGVKRRPWFCFLPSFWCGKKANVDMNSANGPSNIDENDIEPTPTELLGKEAIRISNLTKVYKKFKEEDVVAVDGITLDIYEGQITALLGHNGAGKTTLLNVLTGLIPSTNGSATIFGFNVSDPESLAKIRQMTGICPQQDVLFADLTPQEHLQFYAAIKGVPADEANSQIKEILKQMDLSEQSDTFSSKLSGGQKRKLSLGIALIGNPKVIILDEPTSGVDPYSRHQLWEFLQGYKKDKAILLTTHFMDEADILADRKAILTKGKLRCVGSSLFLKNRFGLGYHLTMVTTTDYNDSNIKSLITTHIPTAVLMGLQGRELLYILPLGETTKFPSLFDALDEIVENENNSYGVKSYGVSMTTLEQVFHRLGDEDEGEVKKSVSEQILQAEQETIHFKQNESNNPNLGNLLPDMQNLPASGTILDGFYALMKIRLLIDLRLPKNFFSVFVSPIIFLSIGFFLLNSSKNVEENLDTPLVLNSDLYKTASEANLLYSNKTGQNIDFLLNGIKALGINVTPFDNVFEDLLEVQPNTYFLNCTDYDVKQQQISVLALYNDTAQHSVPILMNIIDNALLAENPENFQINITSKPIPHSSNNFSFSSMLFGAVFLVGFLFISLPISFASDVVEDREIQVRQLLRVNGLSFWSYWSSSLISHLLLFLVSLLVMIAFLLIFKIEFLTTGPAMFCLIVTYILYLPTSILYYYNLSFLFSKHETALSLLPILSMIFGFVPFLVVMILDAMPKNIDLVPNLHYVFCVIFPLYIPFAGLYFIYKVSLGFHLLNLEPHVSDYFNKTIIIMDCVMIIDCFIYIGILRLIDYYKSRGINFKVQQASMNLEESENSGGSVDEDIVDESKRVQTLILTDGSSLPVIVIKSVYKYFRSNLKRKWCQARNDMDSSSGKLAVKNLSFAVESGEVFGLLGPNGAGKTTTLKIIVAEESPTFGQVLVDGLDIHSGQTEAFQSMGYCPQHDALWKNITLKEHLECYSAIRGIPAKARNEIVEQFIKALNLEEHKNKKVIALSGGTKRKLSFAISLLGMKTKVVLLDEPSTGMDPKSKRFLWNIIRSRFFNGTSGAILTTHSMEEADALCSRVGIMIAGELGCLGSIQHLKNKYGAGYILEIKLTEDSTERGMDLSGLQNFVIELFPHAQIQEQFQNRIKYTISQSGVKSIAQAFHQLQAAKDQQLIQEYSFGQTTLEQVFLQFAKKQKDL